MAEIKHSKKTDQQSSEVTQDKHKATLEYIQTVTVWSNPGLYARVIVVCLIDLAISVVKFCSENALYMAAVASAILSFTYLPIVDPLVSPRLLIATETPERG